MEGSYEFTHRDYRCAKVVHMVSRDHEQLFYYKGKAITKDMADAITRTYLESKNK